MRSVAFPAAVRVSQKVHMHLDLYYFRIRIDWQPPLPHFAVLAPALDAHNGAVSMSAAEHIYVIYVSFRKSTSRGAQRNKNRNHKKRRKE